MWGPVIAGPPVSVPASQPRGRREKCLRLLVLILLGPILGLVLAALLGREAFLDFFAVLQVARDRAEPAGDDFLPFLQALGDFPIRIVTDADLNRRHLG